MKRWRHHWHRGDLGFVGLVMGTLVLIGLVLDTAPTPQQGSSWRRIDLQQFRAYLDEGRLSDHEATWYHPKEAP